VPDTTAVYEAVAVPHPAPGTQPEVGCTVGSPSAVRTPPAGASNFQYVLPIVTTIRSPILTAITVPLSWSERVIWRGGVVELVVAAIGLVVAGSTAVVAGGRVRVGGDVVVGNAVVALRAGAVVVVVAVVVVETIAIVDCETGPAGPWRTVVGAVLAWVPFSVATRSGAEEEW
jgi:hypothetical protein